MFSSLEAGDWIVVGVTVAYFAATVLYATSNNWPSVMIFFGYAFANCGTLWALLKLKGL